MGFVFLICFPCSCWGHVDVKKREQAIRLIEEAIDVLYNSVAYNAYDTNDKEKQLTHIDRQTSEKFLG